MIDRELTNEEKDHIYKESVENAIENIKQKDEYLQMSRRDQRKFIKKIRKHYLSKFL